jgi:hypothetical protein
MNQLSWRSVILRALVAVAVLAGCLHAMAQKMLGSLNGTAVDPAGAAVPGATVTVTDASINETRSTTTQSNGFYQIFNLPIGVYAVKVSHDGFDTAEVGGISIQEAHATTLDTSLKLGKASESVEVTANPLLNATDATNGYTLDSSQIEMAPLATGALRNCLCLRRV